MARTSRPTDTPEFDRDGISHRIRSLLTKTVENGCTEEEAMMAAEKARQLMDKYRLSQTDIEIQAEPIEKIDIDRRNRVAKSAVDRCWTALQRYCGVKVWFSRGEDRVNRATVFGLKSDVEMTRYLYQMVGDFILRENGVHWAKVIKPDPYLDRTGKQRAIWAFECGIADRVSERMTELARTLDNTAKTGSGTALVVVKGQAVDKAFGELDLHFRRGSSGRGVRDGAAYSAGKAAGDRVNLNRPVGRTATRGQLH